jgi:hypothetical protein
VGRGGSEWEDNRWVGEAVRGRTVGGMGGKIDNICRNCAELCECGGYRAPSLSTLENILTHPRSII